jgi:hypothetical protein
MRFHRAVAFLVLFLSLSACSRHEPSKTEQGKDNPPATDKDNPHALKPGDYVMEDRGTILTTSTNDWNHDVAYWTREGFSVIVLRVGWKGRKETGPAAVIMARHPLPKSLDEGGGGKSGGSQAKLEDMFSLHSTFDQTNTAIGFAYAVLRKDAQEEFSLIATRGAPGEGKKYDLSQGRLFLPDLSMTMPQIDQVKTEVHEITPDKKSCERPLTELALKSAVAKSVLEELQRR